MKIDEALTELQAFVGANRQFFPNIALTVKPSIDVKLFPDEWTPLQPPASGVYILFRNRDSEVFYVGIAIDIPRRIYQHIGPGFSWARDGRQCSFPNVTLERPWLSEETRSVLRDGDFRIQAVGVCPFECSALLEAFLIARAFAKEGHRPEINIEF